MAKFKLTTTEISRELTKAMEDMENMSPKEKEEFRKKAFPRRRAPQPKKNKEAGNFLKPIKTYQNGGAVMTGRGGTFKGTF